MLSNSDSSIRDAEESKKDAETMNKCRELLSKLEPSFSAPMKVIMEKFGQQLSGIIKDSLECGICKELIIEVLFKFRQAVSRRCPQTFCYHCHTNWLKESENCPICRDDYYVGVKNPMIDGVIHLLVNLFLTDEERKKRINGKTSSNSVQLLPPALMVKLFSFQIQTKESSRLSALPI